MEWGNPRACLVGCCWNNEVFIAFMLREIPYTLRIFFDILV